MYASAKAHPNTPLFLLRPLDPVVCSKNETAFIPPAISGNASWPVKTRHKKRVKPAFIVATGNASPHWPDGLLPKTKSDTRHVVIIITQIRQIHDSHLGYDLDISGQMHPWSVRRTDRRSLLSSWSSFFWAHRFLICKTSWLTVAGWEPYACII